MATVGLRRQRCTAGVAMAVLLLAAAAESAPGDARRQSLDRLVESVTIYRAGLDRMLPVYEADLARVKDLLKRTDELRAHGQASAAEYETATRLVVAAGTRIEETQREMRQADSLVAELEARKRLLALPPPRPGQYRVAGDVIAYQGTKAWSPAQIGSIGAYFARAFNQTLPVSALGQTPVHDRMGLDHRDAVDIALHPDSAEGRALLRYLRERGIPFLAYRGAAAGSATGAHIHIGPPSIRLGVTR